MDTPPTRKQLTHDRIVETAARAIRRGGFQGVGVADIMKEAGLTHGGFYAHFDSRNALLAEAFERAGQERAAVVAQRSAARQARGATPLRALIEGYLSEEHLDSAETGCPVAALVSEIPRQADEVREAAGRRVRGFVAAVQKKLPEGAPRESAGLIVSQLVGTLQLARAMDDRAQAKALLAATRRQLLAQYDAA
jgi:TetR/AcrR family transcriptional regulator, transcriptional repressor for nem operon